MYGHIQIKSNENNQKRGKWNDEIRLGERIEGYQE